MNYEESKYWLWLTYIPMMWCEKAKKCLDVFGTPRELFEAKEELLEKTGIFSEEDIYNIVSSKNNINIEEKWNQMDKKGIKFVTIDDDGYIDKLRIYEDKPLWLFYKGELPKDNDKLVGMVGARNCSQYGKTMAENIACKLPLYSIGVVSGLARGIDVAAHRGTIMGRGKTYAVLGCGEDICYPRENINTYMEVIANGAVISEYPPGCQPMPWQFPYRNRIISMLSDAVAVLEAKRKSGSLITTDYALKYGKEIFALPGRVTDTLSEGCNDLIKSCASILTEAEDMLFATGVYFDDKDIQKNKNKKIILEKENEVVYSCLDLLPQSIEEIIDKTGMNSSEVYEDLMNLEMDGLVIEPVRNHYARKK